MRHRFGARGFRFLRSWPWLGLVGLFLPGMMAAERLQDAPSAFLRLHAASPVDWQPWSEAVLTRARSEGRPVYVFIGSALHELSRATGRQSLANAENAAFLNGHFVCVLVDREERPDVAAAAQAYLQSVKQTSGWPAHLWLTPELLPFEGDAYLPPTEEWGKRGFIKVAQQAGESWVADPERCRALAAEAVQTMAASYVPPLGEYSADAMPARLAAAAAAWRAEADGKRGAFGAVPAAVDPELVRFMLGQSPEDRAAALGVLRGLLASAACDPVDGGFFRYTADADGHLPYEQKTLADQARLAVALLDAARVSGDEAFARAARRTLDYAWRRLRNPDGTLAAAEDGTLAEHAGYFSWTAGEIDGALGGDAAAFRAAFAVKPGGNISEDLDLTGRHRGRNFLRGDATVATMAKALEQLRRVRDGRKAPDRDARATAGAHGLMLAALARGAVDLREPRLLEAARELFAVVMREFVTGPDGSLRRMAGSAAPAAPADYAAVALGCAEFGRAANVAKADEWADTLLARAGRLFFDPAHGRYLAAPADLPVGIFVRAAALDEAPRAEALALLAGMPGETGALLKRALATLVNEAPLTGGDALLALAP